MFTGLIQSQGKVVNIARSRSSARISIAASDLIGEIARGDSVAINGVCLTAENIDTSNGDFVTTAVTETLARTTLGELYPGDTVNLELSLRPSDRLGGHFLQGHVDAIGRCLGIREVQGSWLIRFSYPQNFGKYLVEKGSIAVDGISLTAYDINPESFTVSIIPHTFRQTTLKSLKPGVEVNLEFDLLGKYIAKQLSKQHGSEAGSMTIQKLEEYGY